MRFLGTGVGELSILSATEKPGAVLDAASEVHGIAFEAGDGWYLIDPRSLERRMQELEAGGTLANFFDAEQPVSVVGPGEEPSAPAIVVHAGGVLGAWVPEGIEEAVAPPPSSIRRAEDILYGELPRSGPRRRRGGEVRAGGAGMASAGFEEAPAAAAAEPPASPGVETIERMPHMDAPEAIAKDPGTAFSVEVYVDTQDLRPGESGEGVSIELPPEVDRVEIGVLLQLSDHFEAAAAGEYGKLTIKRDEDRSQPVRFELRVADELPQGPAVVSVLLTLRGRSCGQVSRAWYWDAEGADAPAVKPPQAASVSTALHVDAAEPDLSIFVTAPQNDGVHYHCTVRTPHLAEFREGESEPFAVPANGYGFVESLLGGITREDHSAEERLRALTVTGQEAWEAAPEILKRVFWQMIDKGVRPEAINIASVEPALPWELMIPRRFDGNEPRKLGPLGTEFAIGRWTRSDGQEPPPKLPVSNSFVVAPQYEDLRMRLDAQAEIDYVVQHLRGAMVEPATIGDLDSRFGREHASLVHFICHGDTQVEGDDAILLEKDETLKARDTEALAGFEEMFQSTHPFVFLNSCSTGRAIPSLAGSSGFPRSFGNLGAHAVVAPLWPVADELAKEIALEIYRTALSPGAPPVASILRDIRKRGYQAKDADTYAAYCFFGDPLARLELV